MLHSDSCAFAAVSRRINLLLSYVLSLRSKAFLTESGWGNMVVFGPPLIPNCRIVHHIPGYAVLDFRSETLRLRPFYIWSLDGYGDLCLRKKPDGGFVCCGSRYTRLRRGLTSP